MCWPQLQSRSGGASLSEGAADAAREEHNMGSGEYEMKVSPLCETVVQYTALIAHKLLHSTLELNSSMSQLDMEQVFVLDVNNTAVPSVAESNRYAAWACLIVERALSRLSEVKTRSVWDLESWVKANYSVYNDEDYGPHCKLFRFQASLNESGTVSWEFHHPEQGEFPVVLGPYRSGATVDQYVASLARIDLLKRAATLGVEL